MGTQARDISEPRERDFLRLPLGVLGYLETLEGRKRVEIVDLSQGGAHILLLEHDDRVASDISDCFLKWLQFDAFGTVTWKDGPRMGLAFEQPLRPGVIKETKKQAPIMVRRDFDELRNAAKLWSKGVFPST